MKDWPYPRIVAHRGGGALAPENTLAAIRLGQSMGYRMHEFDVKLSRDEMATLDRAAHLRTDASSSSTANTSADSRRAFRLCCCDLSKASERPRKCIHCSRCASNE